MGDLTYGQCRSQCRRWNFGQLPWLFYPFFVNYWTHSPCEFGQVARSCGQWGSCWARGKQYWGVMGHGGGRSIREPKAHTHDVLDAGQLDLNNLPQGVRGGAFGGRDLGSDLLGHIWGTFFSGWLKTSKVLRLLKTCIDLSNY
jgi:hypothetical protein